MKKLLLIFLMASIAFAGGMTDSLRVTKSIKTKRLYVDSTALVDSLSSTKRIHAPSANFVELSSGSIPYQNSSGFLANGPIYTDGTNIAVGKTSLETWGPSKVIQVGGTGAISASPTESNGLIYILNNAYHDGTNFKPMYGTGSSYATMYAQSNNGVHSWYSNSGLTADTAFTPTVRMKLDTNGNLTVSNKISSLRDSTSDLIATNSVNGNTGTFSGVVKVDSLNSTKGITSTGRIVGTDVAVSDSVTGNTGTFTGRVKAQSVGELYGTDSVCAIKGHFATTVTSGTASAQYVTATTCLS